MAGAFFARAGPAPAGSQPGDRRREAGRADRPDADRARADPPRGAARRRPRLRRHELDARRRPRRGEAGAAGRPRRGRAALVRPDDARGGQPRRRRPPLDAGCSPRRRRPSRTSPRRGSSTASTLVGDVLQDLAARTAVEVADPAVLVGIEAACGRVAGDPAAARRLPLRDRPPRGEPRSAALRAWADLLGAIARERRPVVLPLHPGTAGGARRGRHRARAGRSTSSSRMGYRTSLALQLHAAAVADGFGRRPARGGVARRAVPRPARRDGVDRGGRGVRRADGRRRARRGAGPGRARPARARRTTRSGSRSTGRRGSTCEPAGAADAIAAALDAGAPALARWRDPRREPGLEPGRR